MRRIWKYKDTDLTAPSPELIEAAEGLPLLARLLAIRGITHPEEARAFLNIAQYEPTDGSEFPDMEKAVERLCQAIDKKEPVLVYGDFDVDGITGTSILVQALRTLKANVTYYVPDRHTEGHGLNSAALCRLVSARQIKVVITTDTGITNFNEVNLLNGLNVDTIITDHHELPENLPQAYAILNPKLLPESSPFIHLCGAGVAFKLSEALYHAHGVPQQQIDKLMDLVAIGTVVDMVPLLRENRYLVWRGLQVLEERERLGLQALLLEAALNETAPITSQTLGFVIGPRLNAVGRLAHANEAVELMLTDDLEKARQLAAKLEQHNRRRKELVEQCLLQADTHLIHTGELTDKKAVILSSNDWNPGVVGLVATRLIEKYNRPCFIGYIDEDTQEVRFSARSIEGFNMHENLQALEDMFIRWGGHSGAAGFVIALKDLQKLKHRLFQLCDERIADEQLAPVTWIDMALSPSQVNPYLVELVDRMAPFGMNNPLPVFGLEGMTVGAQRFMGEDQRHLKLILNGSEPGQYLEAIHWNWGGDRKKLNPTSTFRVAFTAELNTYNGTTKVQLLLKDFQDESLKAPAAFAAPVSKAPRAQVADAAAPEETLTPAALNPEQLVSVGESAMNWVDHRGRDDLEGFLHQMLSAMAGDTDALPYRVYCEGTQQSFPLPLAEAVFCGRNGGPAQHLGQHMLLWDLPPDMGTLAQVLQLHQPKVVHLVGGKYQKMPLCRSPHEFLEGFLKVLHRLWKNNQCQPVDIAVAQLATTLAATSQVAVLGLSLLERLGQIKTTVLSQGETIRLDFSEPVELALPASMSETIDYVAFRQALQEIHRFREWLMTAPLHVIQSAVALELAANSRVLKEERKNHVLDIC